MAQKPRWIIVNRWTEFQHYSDRSVPWIKFYTRLTHDNEWRNLSPARRGILASIWLEYAQSSAKLPADTLELSRRLGAQIKQAQLDSLVHAGFLSIRTSPDLEHVKIGSRPTRARRETETEGERDNPLPPLHQTPKPEPNGTDPTEPATDEPYLSELTPEQRADLAQRMKDISKTIGT